jgi:hypothetical protein
MRSGRPDEETLIFRGHDAPLTLSTYGHTIDELEDQPPADADAEIVAARSTGVVTELPRAAA